MCRNAVLAIGIVVLLIGVTSRDASSQIIKIKRYSAVCVTIEGFNVGAGHYLEGLTAKIFVDPSEAGVIQCVNKNAIKCDADVDCSTSIPPDQLKPNQCHRGAGNLGTGNVPALKKITAECDYDNYTGDISCDEACSEDLDYLSDGQDPDSIHCHASKPNKLPVLGSARWGVQRTTFKIKDADDNTVASGEVVSDWGAEFNYSTCEPGEGLDEVISEEYNTYCCDEE